MSNQITGRLVWVGQTFQIPSKTGGAPFLKREFLEASTKTFSPWRSEVKSVPNSTASG